MADHDNPKVLLAFHRGIARGVESSTQVAVEILIRGCSIIALMVLAHVALGVDWTQLFLPGLVGVGMGVAIRALVDDE